MASSRLSTTKTRSTDGVCILCSDAGDDRAGATGNHASTVLLPSTVTRSRHQQLTRSSAFETLDPVVVLITATRPRASAARRFYSATTTSTRMDRRRLHRRSTDERRIDIRRDRMIVASYTGSRQARVSSATGPRRDAPREPVSQTGSQ